MERQKFFRLATALALVVIIHAGAQAAPKLDRALASRIASASPAQLFGVILTFKGERVTDAHVSQVLSLGIRGGYRMNSLPVVAVNANAAQIARMARWDSLRSIYLNAPVQLYMNQTRPLIGVDRLRNDVDITRRNNGTPVSGRGVVIAINDTGVDGTHQDLTYNLLSPASGKTVQNVIVTMNDKDGLLVRSGTLGNLFEGLIQPVYLENQPNSDTHGGHGTHCASIAAGTGVASGGLYAGVAPGAKVVGLGSGAGLFIVGQIAAFDYILTHQFSLNIRAVNNSWGNSAAEYDAEHPVNVASKALHDNHIAVVFANGNDGGSGPNTQNRWAAWPWTINVGASRKDGRLAGFSSRGLFGHPDLHPTILAPGTGVPDDDDPATQESLTSDIVAARARVNPAANGLDADEQIPAAFLPNYTQISGTSMAAPHVAGVIANVLEADPNLQPDELKSILERTATPLAPYDTFEAGAGHVNVHAAVDLALNPSKPYGNFGFTGKGLALTREDAPAQQGSIAPNTTRTHQITVPENARFTFVELNWGASSAGEGEVVIDNTKLVINDLALAVQRDGQTVASANGINLGGLFGAREGVKMEFPAGGSYTVRVSAGLAGAGVLAEQPYAITVRHYTFDPNEAGDVAGLDAATRAQILRLIYDRVMAADGGFFRPDDELTRAELARALMFAARVPQYIPNRPSFADLDAASPEALFAESLRKEGIMGTSGTTFVADRLVNRLEQAVAVVRALRLDAQARSLAGTVVTVGGEPLTDNEQIAPQWRGYVQIALDKGLMRAYPAEIQQDATGQFVALPGPRFEPGRVVTRSEFAPAASKLVAEVFGE